MMDEAASLERCKGEQPQTSETKGQQEESHVAEETKTPFKRPEKVLPCPRCNSSDTKFCYFNNYNVNQPRYFCKSCQRYWTAGGTVRNVPVGAGRRRNKHLASQYRQLIASSDGSTTLSEASESANNQLLSCEESSSSCATSSSNEMVLKFGPESPHCDVMPTSLNSRGIKSSLNHNALPPQIATLGPNSNISLQFVPASYWNCIPVLVAASGNVSLALPNGFASPSFFSNGSGLQALGKHSRDTSAANGEITDKCNSAPKTLGIHHLDEA